MTNSGAPSGIDLSKPNVTRMYDYYLGGKDNYAIDREVAEQVLTHWPALRGVIRENRAFMQRAVRFLVGEAGIRQFIDLGSGLPTMENVHEVAQAEDPATRVIYVDNDPVVCAHARALLAQHADNVGVVQADLREPAAILDAAPTRELIDFSQPVAILLVAILHFVPDEDDPHRIVRELTGPAVPGSYLIISHAGGDELPEHARRAAGSYDRANAQLHFRTRAEIQRFFDGFDLVPPGLTAHWRTSAHLDEEVAAALASAGLFGVGRKR